MVFTAHTFLLGNVVGLNISIAFDPKFGYLSSSPLSIMDSSKDLEILHISGYDQDCKKRKKKEERKKEKRGEMKTLKCLEDKEKKDYVRVSRSKWKI